MKPIKWEKVLYKKQYVPDNFVQKSLFLSELRKNDNVKVYTWTESVIGVSSLSLQISSVSLFLVLFIYLNDKILASTPLLLWTGALVIVCYVLSVLYNGFKPKVREDLEGVVLFLVFSVILAPVIKTLTETISTNTIYCMVLMMFLAHLVFHNYGLEAAIVSETISLNAATFATTCLASRLKTNMDVYAFMAMSAIFFVIGPITFFKLKSGSLKLYFTLFSVHIFTTSLLLNTISRLFATSFVLLLFVVNILCPYLFVLACSKKQNIYGPWDEAVINEK